MLQEFHAEPMRFFTVRFDRGEHVFDEDLGIGQQASAASKIGAGDNAIYTLLGVLFQQANGPPAG